MSHQVPVDGSARVPDHDEAGSHEILPNLAYKRLFLVNIVFFGVRNAADRDWVLIDAGVLGSTHSIALAAAHRFGERSRPAAIILTHGHFDHVGAVEQLADRWDAPICAHELEMPI